MNNKNFLVYWDNNFPSIKNLDILSKIVDISDKISSKCIVLYNTHNAVVSFERFKQLLENLFVNVEVYGINNLKEFILDSNVTDIFVEKEDLLKYDNKQILTTKNIHIINFEKQEENLENNIDDATDISNKKKEEILNIQKISVEDEINYNVFLNIVKKYLHLEDDIFSGISKEYLDFYLEDIIKNYYYNINYDDIEYHRIENFISLLKDIKNHKATIEQLFEPDIVIEKRKTNIEYSPSLDLNEEEKVFNDTKVLNILNNIFDGENEEAYVNFGIIYNTRNPVIKYNNLEDYIYVTSASSDKLKEYASKSFDKLEVKILHNDEIKVYRFITPAIVYSYNNYTCIDEILKNIDYFINTKFDFNTLTHDIIQKYVTRYYNKYNLKYDNNKSTIISFNKSLIDYYLKNIFISLKEEDFVVYKVLDYLLLNLKTFKNYHERLLSIVIIDFIYDGWEELKLDYINRLTREIFDGDYSSSLEYKGLNNEQYACLITSTEDKNNNILLYSNRYCKYKDVKEKYNKKLQDILDQYYFNLSSVLKIEEFNKIDDFYNTIKDRNFKEDKEYDVSKVNIVFIYKKVVEEALLSAKSINLISKEIYDEKIPKYLQDELTKIYNLTENIFIEMVYELENMIIRYTDDYTEEEIRSIICDIVSIVLTFLYVKRHEILEY